MKREKKDIIYYNLLAKTNGKRFEERGGCSLKGRNILSGSQEVFSFLPLSTNICSTASSLQTTPFNPCMYPVSKKKFCLFFHNGFLLIKTQGRSFFFFFLHEMNFVHFSSRKQVSLGYITQQRQSPYVLGKWNSIIYSIEQAVEN